MYIYIYILKIRNKNGKKCNAKKQNEKRNSGDLTV